MKAKHCGGGFLAAVVFLSAPRVAYSQCDSTCFLVNDASDTTHPTCSSGGTGTCSLRDALTLAQAFSGWSIHFAIGSGEQTIGILGDLPDILHSGTIDGRTQPGFAGSPLIQIRSNDAGTATNGLHVGSPPLLTEGNVTIRALVISHFAGAGIRVENPGSNFIQNCYLGTDASGMAADGNMWGIYVDDFGGDTIGGLTPEDRNVISGNSGPGILISNLRGGYELQDLIQGNYIGTNVLGSAALLNSVAIYTGPPFSGFSPGIVIGGPLGSNAANVIAGDIWLFDGVNDLVQGNNIGLDPTGLNYLSPTGGSVDLFGETNATISNNLIVGNPALWEPEFGWTGTPSPFQRLERWSRVTSSERMRLETMCRRGSPASQASFSPMRVTTPSAVRGQVKAMSSGVLISEYSSPIFSIRIRATSFSETRSASERTA